jgi:hypothetical protein
VAANHDLNALANYYNTTLTQIGTKNFANASFLLDTFHFVNIPPSVNATALAANSDLATVNATAANAIIIFQKAVLAISAKEYVNATALVNEGCALAQQANKSLADFQGPQTSHFKGDSVPVSQYSKGSAAASAEVQSLITTCNSLRKQVAFTGLVLLIGSPQTAIETGGTVRLDGNLTFRGTGVAEEEVLFYINGTYFGSLPTSAHGDLSGTLRIPFIYSRTASVQALARPNSTLGLGGATSNTLIFEILFNQTAIAIGDPPAVLPTFSFNVQGNLSTTSGTALPGAPVKLTFFSQSLMLRTDSKGTFSTRLTVPANATDGIYDVYASFAPQGVFGPSFNFTSIRVVHLPMVLTLSAPSLWFAGFSTTISGTASSNGSALADATITINSPWGLVTTRTNSVGSFSVGVPVSPLEFAFSRNVTASGIALQPYIAQGVLTRSVGLFNFLVVILPAAGVGIIGYEADKLGAFERLKRRSNRQTVAFKEVRAEYAEALASAATVGGPELLQDYVKAMSLAAARFSVRFRPSQTIRETISLVGDKERGPALPAFSEILLTVEDFLYAERFDASRLEAMKKRLAELEGYWK